MLLLRIFCCECVRFYRGNMITYRVCRTVDCPKQVLFDTLRDNQVELNEKLPNIRESSIHSRETLEDGKVRLCSEVLGVANIPLFLKKAVNEDKIRWFVHQDWDYENSRCDYRIEAHYFKDNVDINGTWMFNELDNNKTELQIHNRIRIDAKGVKGVPAPMAGMVSNFVEQVLYNMARPSLVRICSNVEQMIRENSPAAATSS